MKTYSAGPIRVHSEIEAVELALVAAIGGRVEPSPETLVGEMEAVVRAANARTDGDELKQNVRAMLRHGKYKPTGRGKPASEYLVRAAADGNFPRINNLVDAINLVSLASLLPISLIDLGRAGTHELNLRRGRGGESYVFNSAGQSIDLEDLLLIARLPADEPVANPVKDSMITKLTDRATDVVAVIYAPCSVDALATAATQLASLFERHAHGRVVQTGP